MPHGGAPPCLALPDPLPANETYDLSSVRKLVVLPALRVWNARPCNHDQAAGFPLAPPKTLAVRLLICSDTVCPDFVLATATLIEAELTDGGSWHHSSVSQAWPAVGVSQWAGCCGVHSARIGAVEQTGRRR